MREVTRTAREVVEAAGIDWNRANAQTKRLARWAAKNLTQIASDCPECGACPDDGEEHAVTCEYSPAFGVE